MSNETKLKLLDVFLEAIEDKESLTVLNKEIGEQCSKAQLRIDQLNSAIVNVKEFQKKVSQKIEKIEGEIK